MSTNAILEALRAKRIAEDRFNNATGPYVDAAILELSAAELRLSAAIQETRSLFYLDGLDKESKKGNAC